ncbi:MAG: hypothetical protein HY611_09730 [Elusimicrobia bacterium]|nr:hypothetical protein [Elusimicrobiota bacterium]
MRATALEIPLVSPPGNLPGRTSSGLEGAILRALAYADVFDYPLSLEEIHRYLDGSQASKEETLSILSSHRMRREVGRLRGLYALAGRENLAGTRLRRAQFCARLWPRALRYGRCIGRLPFVRLVAVTGGLAMNNVDPDGDVDIDYFIVTAPRRLWLCRLAVLALTKAASRFGFRLCANYFLSEQAMRVPERNLYTAREICQMVPVAGMETYRELRRLNDWTSDFLPNAGQEPDTGFLNKRWAPAPAVREPLQRLAEATLRRRAFDPLEGWAMNRLSRKLVKLSILAEAEARATFTPDWQKSVRLGKYPAIMEAFQRRLDRLGLAERGPERGRQKILLPAFQ